MNVFSREIFSLVPAPGDSFINLFQRFARQIHLNCASTSDAVTAYYALLGIAVEAYALVPVFHCCR